MRENRPSGSEGGETETNRSSLPLYRAVGAAPSPAPRVPMRHVPVGVPGLRLHPLGGVAAPPGLPSAARSAGYAEPPAQSRQRTNRQPMSLSRVGRRVAATAGGAAVHRKIAPGTTPQNAFF